MEQMEKYYRVYADFKESLDKIDSHRYMTAAQALSDDGNDSHIGKVYYRVVDLDWVEAIESTLVYIDKAIREQRRFIEVTEEVVPIEKARNITTESVRHLAQHTNLIARVEGSDVTPERILNIQREESFAIYENRFLYTLLQKLAYFVGLRYKALSDAPNDSFSKVQLHREFQVFDEKMEYDLSFAIESHANTKVDLNADVTTLSGYERVLRIRTVLGDFLSTPLMRELTGCEPVRPPILHTNLMTKNPNFKKSLDLWNYIETYTKPGYQASGNEFDGVLADKYKAALYDTVVLQQFAIELCSNPDLEEQLKEEYEEEKAAAEAARKAAEEEKFKLYEQKAELAVLEERNALREQIERFEKSINSLKKEIADLTVDTENKERKIQRLTSEVKHLEKEVSDRETRILNMQLELDRKNSELEAAKNEVEKYKTKLAESEARVAELEAQIPALTERIAALEAELAAATASIAALTAELAEKAAVIEAKEAEIAALNDTVAALQADVQAKAEQIAALNATLAEREAQIAALNEQVAVQSASIEAKDADIAAKAETIGALEADVSEKASTIAALNTTVAEKSARIEQQEASLQANAAELAEKAAKIGTLEADVTEKIGTIAALNTTVAEKSALIGQQEASLQANAAELAEKARQIASLQADAAEKANAITALQADIQSKDTLLQNNAAALQQNSAEIEHKAAQIASLEGELSARRADITARDAVINEKDNALAARESDIASLKHSIEMNAQAHAAQLEKQRLQADKQREAEVSAARKEELAAYKKKIAEINASAKQAVAAATLAAESAAKAKMQAAKNIKVLDNGLSTDAFRALVRRACAIEKAPASGKASVFVDDYNADCAALAAKYGLAVLHLAPIGGRFEKTISPIEALDAMAPMLEAGNDIYYFASSEKKTGAMSTVALAAGEAQAQVISADTQALPGSAIAQAIGVSTFSALGDSADAIASKRISAVTYLGGSQLGMLVKGKFKRIAKTDAPNLAQALEHRFAGCDKRFAFVLLNGMSAEEAAWITQLLQSESGFERVIAEPTADAAIKGLGVKSATIYYFDE